MRQEFIWLQSKINKGDAVLDVGPLEGAEVEVLVAEAGHVTCVNLKGKTPVDGAAYVPCGSASRLPSEGGEFDVVAAVHLLNFVGMGAFGLNEDEIVFVPAEFSRVLQDDGRVLLAVPVGIPNVHRLKEGMTHVFHRDEIVNLFSEFNLVSEDYITSDMAGGFDWDEIYENEGVENRAVKQVGLFEFSKASVKPQAKSKKKKKPVPEIESPISMEADSVFKVNENISPELVEAF